MKGKGIIVVLIIILAIVLFIVACGGIAFLAGRKINKTSNNTSENDSTAEVSEETAATTSTSQEEEVQGSFDVHNGSEEGWPSDLLGEVPEFTYGTVTDINKEKNPETEKDIWVLTLDEVDDQASEEYKQDLENLGWNIYYHSDLEDLVTMKASIKEIELELYIKTTLGSGLLTVQYT